MKKSILLPIVLLFIGSLSFTSCKSDLPEKDDDPQLSEVEKNDLRFLREEEKLARDVYLFSFDKHGQQIFENISKNEQKHMDKVLELLNKYGIEDAAHPERGKFYDNDLQMLYVKLTAKADSSLVDALLVGATIEDLDINDLDHMESRTSASDLLSVYGSLKCGSTNHMRSFHKKIKQNGADYTPKYISQKDFDEIIAGSNGPCG